MRVTKNIQISCFSHWFGIWCYVIQLNSPTQFSLQFFQIFITEIDLCGNCFSDFTRKMYGEGLWSKELFQWFKFSSDIFKGFAWKFILYSLRHCSEHFSRNSVQKYSLNAVCDSFLDFYCNSLFKLFCSLPSILSSILLLMVFRNWTSLGVSPVVLSRD